MQLTGVNHQLRKVGVYIFNNQQCTPLEMPETEGLRVEKHKYLRIWINRGVREMHYNKGV